MERGAVAFDTTLSSHAYFFFSCVHVSFPWLFSYIQVSFDMFDVRVCLQVWRRRNNAHSWGVGPYCALRNAATHCNTFRCILEEWECIARAGTRCNTLQHTATHSWGVRPYCALHNAATHCNALRHNATHFNAFFQGSETVSCAATHCNTLQHIVTHCNTFQRILQEREPSRSSLRIPCAHSKVSMLRIVSFGQVIMYIYIYMYTYIDR